MINHSNTGMKMTPQRMAILNFLDGNLTHPSAADIFREISANFPTMSMATVYNTLETLVQKGLIQELGIDPYKKRFDPNPDHHHHLICIHCREINDIFSNFSLELKEKEKKGFEITGNHVDFYGICPKCRELKNSKNEQ